MAPIVRRPIVVFVIPTSVPEILKTGDTAVGAFEQHANVFTDVSPPLPQVKTDLAALSTAFTEAQQTGSRTARTAVKDAKKKVHLDLRGLEASAQRTLDKSDPEQAASLVTLVAMRLKKDGHTARPEFFLKNAPISGAVHAVVRRVAKRAAYEWQYSLDGGKTWIQVPATLEAKTTFTGLPVGATVLVRWRPVLKGGQPQDWRQPLSIVVQ